MEKRWVAIEVEELYGCGRKDPMIDLLGGWQGRTAWRVLEAKRREDEEWLRCGDTFTFKAIKMDKRFTEEDSALDERGDGVEQPPKAEGFMSYRARPLQRRPPLPFTLGWGFPDPFVDARLHVSQQGRATEEMSSGSIGLRPGWRWRGGL